MTASPDTRPSGEPGRETFTVDTSDHHLVDVTDEVVAFCTGRGDGLVSIFVPPRHCRRRPHGDRIGSCPPW